MTDTRQFPATRWLPRYSYFRGRTRIHAFQMPCPIGMIIRSGNQLMDRLPEIDVSQLLNSEVQLLMSLMSRAWTCLRLIRQIVKFVITNPYKTNFQEDHVDVQHIQCGLTSPNTFLYHSISSLALIALQKPQQFVSPSHLNLTFSICFIPMATVISEIVHVPMGSVSARSRDRVTSQTRPVRNCMHGQNKLVDQ